MRMLVCMGLLLAGCSSLDGVEKSIPASAVISPCDICNAPGVECTPCCTACAIERCGETCRRIPRDCEMCEDYAYWDCYYQMCTNRN